VTKTAFLCKIQSKNLVKTSLWAARIGGPTIRLSITTFFRKDGSINHRDRYWYISRRRKRLPTSGTKVQAKVPTRKRRWLMEQCRDKSISFRPFATRNSCEMNGPSGVAKNYKISISYSMLQRW